MAFDSVLRTDILSEEIKTDPTRIKIFAETQFINILNSSQKLDSLGKTKTPGPAKNIVEVMDLLRQAIEDYEKRERINEDAKVHFLYENPDREAELESISCSLTERNPGMFAQGRPNESPVRQLRPLLRELLPDPDNPGYRRAVLGQFYDNTLTLTCWARTNKQANERALWLETVMEEYRWFFVYSGVNRVEYQGRRQEEVRQISNNKIYGRPIDYYVRTEKLRSVSQKELEEICVRLATVNS